MIHFVGAGSGAKDLITVRGAKLLSEADVVIYTGSLVNPELLEYCPQARVHDSADMTLEQIISIMAGAEDNGLMTVRLQTGDPSVYGAIREQMDELDRLGIEYDLCPGVSAAFGAASAMNLEYTLPGVSQTLIITRMEGRTPVPESESIESLAAHHSSMAVYLSAGMTEELSRRLIAGGYDADTPAAIVYKATWPDEECHMCTVGTLYETAKAHGITRTALIIAGDAVNTSAYRRSVLYAADKNDHIH